MTEVDSVREGDRESIAAVLGRTPSGVFVVTAGDASGRETGMLASWIQQASFEPPMVSLAIHSKRYLNDWLAERPQLVINLLGEKQTNLLSHFGKGFEPDAAAFEGLSISRSTTGLPILDEALGYLEGTVRDQVTAGDHRVYLVEITAAGASEQIETRPPMVHIRKDAFRY